MNRIRIKKFLPGLTLLLWLSTAGSPLPAQDKPSKKPQKIDQVRKEEGEDYFKKWLQEDVKYIIADEERDVFSKLTTDEEREAFIEQFWFRRDPDPRSTANEFKEEHYRRMAFVNEKFRSGKPGWMTDRGRVYIIHGAPEYIESYPSGGSYYRKAYEGGGKTFTYPFEVWSYREVKGVGQDVELEFVDPSFSGEYRLALRPEEKDMLLYVSGTAATIKEVLGFESGRVDRPFFNPGLENNSAWRAQHNYRAQDAPFARYARFAQAQRAQKIEFFDLKEMVTTNITFSTFPFEFRADYVKLNDVQVLAPITVLVENHNLTFSQSGDTHQAKVNIYGIVKNMGGRIEAEFEDSVVAEYRSDDLERGRSIQSVYQRPMVLDSGKRYRVDIIVRDENSGQTGVVQTGLNVPAFKETAKLETGSLILSRFIEAAPETVAIDERFVLGDLKIIPNVNNQFAPGDLLTAYLQVYNLTFDQASLIPQVQVYYQLRRDGKLIQEFQDHSGDSVQYFSPQRVVLLRQFNLENFEPGQYRLDVLIEDRITHTQTTSKEEFKVVGARDNS